jgi:hypothetical protein
MSKTWHRKRSWGDDYDSDHEPSTARKEKKQRIREERMAERQLQRAEEADNISSSARRLQPLGRQI